MNDSTPGFDILQTKVKTLQLYLNVYTCDSIFFVKLYWIKMCKRRATLFTIIAVFSFAILLILGIALGSEYWTQALLERDISRLNSTGTGNLPLKGYLGENPIDGSDPGAFRGLMNFGLFAGCKRFNYAYGVRKPSCFSGWFIWSYY